MVDKRMWATQTPLRQFGDVPEVKRLHNFLLKCLIGNIKET